MSEIVVRPYEQRDQEETWHVRAMTYNSGRPIPIEQQVYKTSTPFVGEVDGRVVGTFVIMDMECTRGPGVTWKTGGIAGVAVLPEARQTGVGAAMMRWSLGWMRDNGYILASLYAFRDSYYRTFGYEVCGLRHKVTCPNHRLPRTRASLPIRRIPYAELDAVKPCYEAFAKCRGGMNLRSQMHWNRIILDDEKYTIYGAGVPVEAYVIVEHDWRFWEHQPLIEVAWTTPKGYDSILSFLGSIGINKTSVSWYEPSDGLMLQSHLDQGVTLESEKPVMYRLLNVEAGLSSLTSTKTGSFTVSITDPELPDNQGPWKVEYFPGKTTVVRGDKADFNLDRRHAVQALLGQPSLDDLVRNAVCQDSADARALLTPLPVFCIDYF